MNTFHVQRTRPEVPNGLGFSGFSLVFLTLNTLRRVDDGETKDDY